MPPCRSCYLISSLLLPQQEHTKSSGASESLLILLTTAGKTSLRQSFNSASSQPNTGQPEGMEAELPLVLFPSDET